MLFQNLFGQGTTNKGTDFWLGYGNHVSGYSSPIRMGMVVYITSDVNTSGVVSTPGNTDIPFTVTANAVQTITIPQNAYIGNAEGKINKGIHITSIKPVVVYAHIYDASVSGATLVIPTNTLGKDYYSINYDQVSNSDNSHSFFFVIAVEDNTQIVITPSVNTLGGLQAGVASAPITLQKGEIYQVLGLISPFVSGKGTGGDLTGSRIQSVSTGSEPCKRIAVFSGSGKISIGCLAANGSPGTADNLFQQVYPTSTWGNTFITVPLKSRNYDVYRIFKSDPNSVVKLNGVIVPNSSFKNNLYYDFPGQSANYIESDKPIQVIQYAVTQGKNITCTTLAGDVGDPEMIFLNPLEQTLTNITMYSTPLNLILNHFINVVIKTADVASFKLDNVVKTSSFSAVAGSPGYSYAQFSVAAGTHNLIANGGFNAIAYGFGGAESYGYAAGANLVSKGLEATVNGTTKTTGCVQQLYDFKVTLGYAATKFVLDLGDGNPPAQIPVVLDSTYQLNGVNQYVYRLTKGTFFTTIKTYNIKLFSDKPNSDGCGSTDESDLDLTIYDIPSPAFTASNIQTCIGIPVTFTSTSTDNGNTIVKWYWDYGDGTKEVRTDGKPFTHSYLTGGDFAVTLMVEGTSGCQSPPTSAYMVHVNKLPEAKFNAQTVKCPNKDIQFNDQSIANEGTLTKWTWDFGDVNASPSNPNSSSAQNPVHRYSKPGTYTVKLVVETDKGCISLVNQQNIVINVLPVPDFSNSDNCLTDGTAQFTDKSTIADGSQAQFVYNWNFGDQLNPTTNTSTLQNPTHKYSQAGIYQVSLTVSSNNSCDTTIIKPFTVAGSVPIADFSVQNSTKLCSNQPVTFLDKAAIAFGEITRIDWYYDYANNPTTVEIDNNPALRNAASKTYSHNYPSFNSPLTKTYTVRMVAYSGTTCLDDEIKVITINANPHPDFDIPDFCLSDGAAVFTNHSTIGGGNSGLTYMWNFGDQFSSNNTSTQATGTHLFSKVGVYPISLTVTSAVGCDTVLVKNFTVNGSIPKADFIVQNSTLLCSDQPVKFADKATVDFGEITRIDWYYDYGNAPTVKYTDNSPGLRADPKIYTNTYPTFSTPLTKTIQVRMVAFSGSGSSTSCVAEVTKTITLKAVPLVDFTLPDACVANGLATFTDKSTIAAGGEPFTYLWDFGDKNANPQRPNTSTDQNPSHAFTEAGTYQITSTVTAANGCAVTLIKPYIVAAAIPKPDFDIVNETSLCSDQPVNFTDKATIAFGEITRIEWYYDYINHPADTAYRFTDNSPALRLSPGRQYTFLYPVFHSPLSQTISVRMQAFSGQSCVSDIVKTITLKAVPEVVFDQLTNVCQEKPEYQITEANEVSGFPGSGVFSGDGISTTGIFNPLKAGLGKHTITYTFTGSNGCINLQSQDITVYPTPFVDVGPDLFVLEGGQIQLSSSTKGSNLTYRWTPATGLDHDDIANPIATPADDMTYTLTVTSDQGCSSSDAVFVKVLKDLKVANTFSPNGDGVHDVWNIPYLESYPGATVQVFNRYGERVFNSMGYSIPWDGRSNGKDLPVGTYYYLINPQNGRKTVSGYITLIR